jgi:hypothetical protein
MRQAQTNPTAFPGPPVNPALLLAELVGHLAKVDKAVNITYTLQYLTSQALHSSISAQLKPHFIVNSNVFLVRA